MAIIIIAYTAVQVSDPPASYSSDAVHIAFDVLIPYFVCTGCSLMYGLEIYHYSFHDDVRYLRSMLSTVSSRSDGGLTQFWVVTMTVLG